MSVTELPKLYTDAEAAQILRCSPMTIGRLRRAGRLGYTHVAKKVFVTNKHIEQYLESQENSDAVRKLPSCEIYSTQVKFIHRNRRPTCLE